LKLKEKLYKAVSGYQIFGICMEGRQWQHQEINQETGITLWGTQSMLCMWHCFSCSLITEATVTLRQWCC